ncbi:hypothetical protein E3O55_07280 [Cryobacterium sp. MDB1-18-2]|uniref:hypothetical protein n=1 Tax=unclassified Cryobacterium TaxID=2649013 RepID=UPI00106AEB6B|nr:MULTISPECIES: hypothetical protein [unclassified Cryobacterium]TFC30779.1 hypothetical protein E3O55_07280 [Cryobacterium sp. MDB1-18-2]TFC38122.1 hypothetical protein E3O50_17000 [Cryobacterium sp. MDB1-18-1]
MKDRHIYLRVAGLITRLAVFVVALFALSTWPSLPWGVLVIAVLLMIASLSIDEILRRAS